MLLLAAAKLIEPVPVPNELTTDVTVCTKDCATPLPTSEPLTSKTDHSPPIWPAPSAKLTVIEEGEALAWAAARYNLALVVPVLW